jgi:hypothetical protein
MNEDYEPLNHRTFLLTMSPQDGQEIAEMAGFSLPSEATDVMGKWFTLKALGLLDDITKCSEWVSHIIQLQNDLDEKEVDVSVALFTSFGVSLITMLLDNQDIKICGEIPLVIPPDALNQVISVISMFSIDPPDFDDDDEDDGWDAYFNGEQEDEDDE